MQESKHPIPAWVTRGKTIRQLINELQTFEDQDMEVRISVDYGDSHFGISMVGKHKETFCLLLNAESHYRGAWQAQLDAQESQDAAPQP